MPGVPGEWFQFALEARSDGILVGDLALKVDADEPREAEVGFTLAPAQQGKGYGTEALSALLDYAFEAFELHRVVAVTDALNAPAAALLERVGMRREGHFVENVFFKGAWGSELGFAILEREWSARRSQPVALPTVSRTTESSTASRECRESGMMIRSPGEPFHRFSPATRVTRPCSTWSGGLARVLVLVEVAAGPQGDQGLAQDVLVPAVDRVGASAAGRRPRRLQVVADQRGQ